MTTALVSVGILQAVVYLLFVRAVDLYEREPLRYVLPVFVWGFTVAVVVALVFNTLFAATVNALAGMEAADFLTAVVSAPVVEESAKGLALLLTFGVAYLMVQRGAMEFSGVMDGIVYGSAVGFGFAIAEDLLYFAQFGPETFVVRRVFGGFAHAAFTSLIGIGIGLVPWARSTFLKVLLPLLGLSAAIVLHAIFNLTAYFFGALVYGLLFLVVVGYVVLILVWLGVERRTIQTELREEVELGTINQRDYELLPTVFGRTGYYLRLLFSGRVSELRRSRLAHGTAADLAFTKRLSGSSYTAEQQDRIRRLRQKIVETRGIRRPASGRQTSGGPASEEGVS